MKIRHSLIALIMIFCLLNSCNRNKSGVREFNQKYTGEYLNRVAFPVGGIGAGMFCIEGTGAISHMSVRNRPEIFNEPCTFAAIHVDGYDNATKVLEGPVPSWKIFGSSGTGNGAAGTSFGLPRFEEAEFIARFPFAMVALDDRDIPMNITLECWSPFIPGDADNSSLPVGAIEYSFTNTSGKKLDAVFSWNAKNFMSVNVENSIRPINGGFILHQDTVDDHPDYMGDFAVFTDDKDASVNHCWFRGGWWDPMTMAWKNISEGDTEGTAPVTGSAPGASIYVPFKLQKGETKIIRLFFSWYVPDTELRYGADIINGQQTNMEQSTVCCGDSVCETTGQYYRPWYASRFINIKELGEYWISNYVQLKEKSMAFRDALYDSTLPPEVLEAVAANLTILKSPTVLRQADGRLWAWEGCSDNSGCCAGSCTHVWNYAQAIPHLFPSLERSFRETEFMISQDESGHQVFRSGLPLRPIRHEFYAASDGQLGGIMKVYRDWRISGDNKWIEKMWPYVKLSMDYCIETWDPRHRGVLEEPHHNTYDIEFWGPDPMCSSFYLGALTAIIEIGDFLGEDTGLYKELQEKGTKYYEENLFNGEFFIQKITTSGLNAKDPVAMAEETWSVDYSDEATELLIKEGPKYQYGNGCLSDGILGMWLVSCAGLEEVLNNDMVTDHLLSVHRYNLRTDLGDHANPQRPSFAMGDDGGLLLCSWPKGGELSLPFVYSNEVWTGIEYQVASHLMMKGKVEEGLDIVRTCRERYDGRIRNPFNEYECGHWYARAMSSYGLLQGLTGIRYDAIDKVLYIDSRIGDDFVSYLSTETGFGNAGLRNGEPFLDVKYGNIEVKEIRNLGKERSSSAKATEDTVRDER
jgi:uncharacterized protein (DUF608 family)